MFLRCSYRTFPNESIWHPPFFLSPGVKKIFVVRQRDSAAGRAIFFLSLKSDVRLKQGEYETIHISSTEPIWKKNDFLSQKKHFQLRQKKTFFVTKGTWTDSNIFNWANSNMFLTETKRTFSETKGTVNIFCLKTIELQITTIKRTNMRLKQGDYETIYTSLTEPKPLSLRGTEWRVKVGTEWSVKVETKYS